MLTASVLCPLCESEETAFFYAEQKNFQQHYLHCKTCDLVFVAPDCRLDRRAEKARYDMHNNDYSEAYVNFLSRLADPLLAKLPPQSKGLDFGSGISQAMTNLFRDQGHNCACYDIFYYPDENLLKARYDFIVASEVIEHLYQPKQVFEQWLSMLKPQGILAIMTTLRPEDTAFAQWWYKNDPTHVALFSHKTFAFLQAQYGLISLFSKGNVQLFRQAGRKT